MGVSGAGKTTLMDVLAGRKTGQPSGFPLRSSFWLVRSSHTSPCCHDSVFVRKRLTRSSEQYCHTLYKEFSIPTTYTMSPVDLFLSRRPLQKKREVNAAQVNSKSSTFQICAHALPLIGPTKVWKRQWQSTLHQISGRFSNSSMRYRRLRDVVDRWTHPRRHLGGWISQGPGDVCPNLWIRRAVWHPQPRGWLCGRLSNFPQICD